MKKALLFLLSFILTATAFAQGNPVQESIDAAFGESFATQQDQLSPLIARLQKAGDVNDYWIAYGQFHASIFLQQTGNRDEAEKAIKAALALLEKKESNTAEEHALLGYMLGYSIAFDPGAAGTIAAKAAGHYKQALKKDANNMRAYVGLGVSDFRTPPAFGGGRKAEEYLLKAISLPEQSSANGPSWGKNTAFYTLASFYQREGKTDKAKMYCMQGLNKYPNDPQLNQLKQQL